MRVIIGKSSNIPIAATSPLSDDACRRGKR